MAIYVATTDNVEANPNRVSGLILGKRTLLSAGIT